MGSVVCVAKFVAKENCSERLREELAKLVEPTLKEEGCIDYKMCQSLEDSKILTMVETFSSKDALEFHGQQPYIEHFKTVMGDIIDDADIHVYSA